MNKIPPVVGGKYNWKGQPEKLIYLGMCEPRNGRWHQFALVNEPTVVWCEVTPGDLDRLEETETHDFHDREDGLAHCKVCGGAEGALPTECPGLKMSPEALDEVYAGRLDYQQVKGGWFWKDSGQAALSVGLVNKPIDPNCKVVF